MLKDAGLSATNSELNTTANTNTINTMSVRETIHEEEGKDVIELKQRLESLEQENKKMRENMEK